MNEDQLVVEIRALREVLEKMSADIRRIREENQQLRCELSSQLTISPIHSEVM